MFCPKCGSILFPKKEKNKSILLCSCGYSKKAENLTTREVLEKEKIIEPVEEIETLPLASAKCPKCGHNRAYYWLVQTRAGDEPETKFYKCEKCKSVWRDYG